MPGQKQLKVLGALALGFVIAAATVTPASADEPSPWDMGWESTPTFGESWFDDMGSGQHDEYVELEVQRSSEPGGYILEAKTREGSGWATTVDSPAYIMYTCSNADKWYPSGWFHPSRRYYYHTPRTWEEDTNGTMKFSECGPQKDGTNRGQLTSVDVREPLWLTSRSLNHWGSSLAVENLAMDLASDFASAVSRGADPCFEALQYGTHQAESSVSDQTLACDAARQAGRAYAELARDLVVTFGTDAIQAARGFVDPRTQPQYPAPDENPPGTGSGDSGDTGSGGSDVDPYFLKVRDRILEKSTGLSAEDADHAAASCIAEEGPARAAGVVLQWESPCLDDALFFPGADAGWAAVNDRRGISASGDLARLTYVSGKDQADGTYRADGQGLPRGWYDRVAYGNPGQSACGDNRNDRGVQCDEYPFYTSTQAAGPGTVLMAIPTEQNRAEGLGLLSMYQDPTCRMATDWDEQENPGSGSARMFVVPLAYTDGSSETDAALFAASFHGPDTFHVCGASAGSMAS